MPIKIHKRITLVFFISIVFLKKAQQIDLENKIPFVSKLSPPFPLCIPRRSNRVERSKGDLVPFSLHNIIITFRNCNNSYFLQPKESITIEASKSNIPYIFATFSNNTVPYSGTRKKCSLEYLANVPFNLDGFPLNIFYSFGTENVIENSYIIKFILADLLLNFDKMVYRNGDFMIVRCIAVFPRLSSVGNISIITPNNNSFIVKSKKRYANDFIAELKGIILFDKDPLNFSCILDRLIVHKSPIIERPVDFQLRSYVAIYSIGYVALAVSLVIFLVILILLGICILIVGWKQKLSHDKACYYTELLEDRTIRFANPIINNLTSPLRKYRLPGILTAYQLRRNFKHLIALLMSKFAKETIPKFDDRTVVSQEEILIKEMEVQGRYNDPFLGILHGKTAISVGPLPQETPRYEKSSFVTQTENLTPLEQLVSGAEPITKSGTEESLDRHVIGTLPYTRLFAQKNPHWLVQTTPIPVKTGISSHAKTYTSQETK